MAEEIISRAQARAQGLKYYFSGEPCPKGHIGKRRVCSGDCLQCKKEKQVERYWMNVEVSRAKARACARAAGEELVLKKRQWKRNWTKENPQRALESGRQSSRRYKEKHPNAKRKPLSLERGREKNRKYKERHPETYLQICKAHDANRKRAKQGRGSFTSKDIDYIISQQRKRCGYCRKKLIKYHVDHIVALSKGGSNERRNLQILCAPCNLRKNAKDPIDYARSQGLLL